MKDRNIAKVVTKTTTAGQGSDRHYWLSRPPEERIAALEEIRREFNSWKYTDAEQRFQRVYRIVKLK
jgi:hypothetical protein